MAQNQQRQGPAAQAPAQSGQSSQERPEAKPDPKQRYRVLQRIFVGKEAHQSGTFVELTLDEAKSLGDAVTTNLRTPEVEDIQAREGGLYEIVGPGSVWLGGKRQGPGAVIELDAADARQIGKLIKKVA